MQIKNILTLIISSILISNTTFCMEQQPNVCKKQDAEKPNNSNSKAFYILGTAGITFVCTAAGTWYIAKIYKDKEKNKELDVKDKIISDKINEISSKENSLKKALTDITSKDQTIADKDSKISAKEKELAEKTISLSNQIKEHYGTELKKLLKDAEIDVDSLGSFVDAINDLEGLIRGKNYYITVLQRHSKLLQSAPEKTDFVYEQLIEVSKLHNLSKLYKEINSIK